MLILVPPKKLRVSELNQIHFFLREQDPAEDGTTIFESLGQKDYHSASRSWPVLIIGKQNNRDKVNLYQYGNVPLLTALYILNE